jgi:hypothetical protein
MTKTVPGPVSSVHQVLRRPGVGGVRLLVQCCRKPVGDCPMSRRRSSAPRISWPARRVLARRLPGAGRPPVHTVGIAGARRVTHPPGRKPRARSSSSAACRRPRAGRGEAAGPEGRGRPSCRCRPCGCGRSGRRPCGQRWQDCTARSRPGDHPGFRGPWPCGSTPRLPTGPSYGPGTGPRSKPALPPPYASDVLLCGRRMGSREEGVHAAEEDIDVISSCRLS